MTTDPLWPGLHRAGAVLGTRAVLEAMVEVEAAWLAALEGQGLAPAGSAAAVQGVTLTDAQLEEICVDAEGGGTPVVPLLARLRAAMPGDAAAGLWVHRGLTSQDVVDTALALLVARVLGDVLLELEHQQRELAALARAHRLTPMVGRTLGQHAVPITFGVKVAGWLQGLLAAAAQVSQARAGLAVQLAGAAGTRAAVVEVCRLAGSPDPVAACASLVDGCAERLGLGTSLPWHTSRARVTAAADALVTASDAWGHCAADIATLARPEIGELGEPAALGRGVSSAMPHKRNPVLAVLLRRHALSAPLLGAHLHLASASAVDERPDGAWHAEWAALRDLAIRTLAAARQATELLSGLEVHGEVMRANLDASLPATLSERLVPALGALLPGGATQASELVATCADAQTLAARVRELVEPDRLSDEDLAALGDPTAYLGACGWIVDQTVALVPS